MRVVFMGTPDFAVPSLRKLIEHNYHVCAVFCQPDKPKGRGHKMQFPPVKEAALNHDIPVYQPVSLKDEAIQARIKEMNPDIIIVVAYGKILPKTILDMPKYGCVNVHGSLLPKYRGAAPIQWAVLNGEKTTGVTTMYLAEGMDTGDMILKSETLVGEEETSGELFDRLKEIGADLLIETLKLIETGQAAREPQNEAEATYAPMLKKEDARIDWSWPAEKIHNWIRGMNPQPCAFSMYQEKKMKLFRAEIVPVSGEPGKVLSQNGEMVVCCGVNGLLLKELQPENGKRMDGKSFLLGHPIDETSYFI